MIPLQDSKTSHRFPIQTVLLVGALIYIFYVEFTSVDLEAFLLTYALIPATVSSGDPTTWIPFITAIFLHGGFLHLLFNGIFLWVFGDNIEDRLGLLYIPFFVLGGVIGNIAQYLLNPTSILPIVGASGAIAAILGAYIVTYPHNRIKTLVPIFFFVTIIEVPALLMLGYWFVLQIFNGYTSISQTANGEGGVAYFAHIGGFIFGLIVGFFIKNLQKDPVS